MDFCCLLDWEERVGGFFAVEVRGVETSLPSMSRPILAGGSNGKVVRIQKENEMGKSEDGTTRHVAKEQERDAISRLMDGLAGFPYPPAPCHRKQPRRGHGRSNLPSNGIYLGYGNES